MMPVDSLHPAGHRLWGRTVTKVFQFGAQNLDVARRGQAQGDSFTGDALDDNLDRIADDDAFSNSPAQDQHGSLSFLLQDRV